MGEERKLQRNKLIKNLDLPEDIFLGYANISLYGNRELYICNHKGIMSYGQEEIILLTKEFQLLIKGKALEISSYTRDELTISGYIHSLEYI